MQHTTDLATWLGTQLPWHGARIKFIALFLLALIRNKTVNFSKLALDFGSDAKSESSYRRIQNFFANFSFEQDLLARLLLSLLPLKDKRVLLMDRSNWRFGQLDINILLIAVYYRGIGIPLVWSMLPKAGNSSSQEQQDLMDRLLRLVPAETIDVFLADREFIGKSWFAYLNQRRVPFVIRIRKDSLCDGWLGVHCFFKNLPLAQAEVLYHRYSIFGESLAVAGMRLEDDYCIVVINSNPQLALARYRLRWSIELLFVTLKTTGFSERA